MIETYKPYGFTHRYIQANVSKLIRANWKAAAEQGASDGFHTLTLHRWLGEIGKLADNGSRPAGLMRLATTTLAPFSANANAIPASP